MTITKVYDSENWFIEIADYWIYQALVVTHRMQDWKIYKFTKPLPLDHNLDEIISYMNSDCDKEMIEFIKKTF
jgi:hypothetical protein